MYLQLLQQLTEAGLAAAGQKNSFTEKARVCPQDHERVRFMHTRKAQQPAARGERRSAAWGKRFGVLVLVLVTELAFAGGNGGSKNAPVLGSSTSGSSTSRVQPELHQLLAK